MLGSLQTCVNVVTLHHPLGRLCLSLCLLPHAQQVECGVRGNVLILLTRHGVTHCKKDISELDNLNQ